jgi:hypothetical protein
MESHQRSVILHGNGKLLSEDRHVVPWALLSPACTDAGVLARKLEMNSTMSCLRRRSGDMMEIRVKALDDRDKC